MTFSTSIRSSSIVLSIGQRMELWLASCIERHDGEYDRVLSILLFFSEDDAIDIWSIKMVPYSLSACQVVRVFCAVLRALGTSPIMSLEIVFLTGYPTVKLLCNAISFSLLFHSLLLNIT